MEALKKLLGETVVKLKLLVGVVIAGLLVGVAAWRKHVQDEWAKQDQISAEQNVKDDAAAKLAAETARLEAEKKAAEAKLEEQKKEAEAKLEVETKAKAEKLKKGPTSEVKKEAAEVLGLKEKKKKKGPSK